MATPTERAAAERKDKLADIQRQITNGTLRVRKMTATERKRNPALARPKKPQRSR